MASSVPAALKNDKEALAVAAHLKEKLSAETLGGIFRGSLDAAVNSSVTGRYHVDELQQSEKTAIGTQVEIGIRRALDASKGKTLDLLLDGIEVDIKWSTGKKGKPGSSWMVPREAFGHLLCLVTAWDTPQGSYFSLGVMRVKKYGRNLNAPNRDKKRSIPVGVRENDVWWLFRDEKMPRNVFLGLEEEARKKILAAPAGEGRMLEALSVCPSLSPQELWIMDAPDPLHRLASIQAALKARGFHLGVDESGHWNVRPDERV